MVMCFYEADLEKQYARYSNNVLQFTDVVTSAFLLTQAVVCLAHVVEHFAAWQISLFLALCSTAVLPPLLQACCGKWYLRHREWVLCVTRLAYVCVAFDYDRVMYRLEEATSPWGSFFTNMLLLGGQYLQLFVFALLWQTRMTFHLPLQVLCLTLLICSYPSKLAQVHKLPGTFKQLQCLQQAVVGAAHLLQLPPSIVAHLQALTEPSGFLMRYWIFMMVVFGLAVSTWILWVVEVRRRQVFLKRLDLHPDTPIECYLAQMLPLLGLLSLQAISSWWQVDGIQAVHTGL